MELIDIYNSVDNPIDDMSVIEKLIDIYSDSVSGGNDFYSKLIRTSKKEYDNGQYYLSDGDKFHSTMFNKWKNSIRNMTKEEYIDLFNKGSFGNALVPLRNYLLTVDDVSTKDEANNILYGKKSDKILEDAIDEYSWSSFGGTSGWIHVCSRYLTAKKEEHQDVKHRLYLNTESVDTYKLVNLLVEKFDQHKTPYYFKFSEFANRDDTIVMYSSNENLVNYVNILKEIKKENPELVSRCVHPPILTGKIDEWIGYGSNREKDATKKGNSFNGVRANIIEDVITNKTKEWIVNHQNDNIKYEGNQIDFKSFFTIKSTENFLSKLESKYTFYENYEKRKAAKSGSEYDNNVGFNKFGFTFDDIKSEKFFRYIYKHLGPSINQSFEDMIMNDNFDSISIDVKNGKKIEFSETELDMTIREIASKISSKDSDFKVSIQEGIKIESSKMGIDPEKFCFDTYISKELKNNNIANNNEVSYKQKNIDYTINSMFNNENIYMNSNDFISTLNPALTDNIVTLPSGSEVSAKQYIEEFVFPHLPKEGTVTLSNNFVVPTKQFVEEYVLFECQSLYNGDFSKYLVNNTKSNNGVISLEKGNEEVNINPVEIVEYINPEILNNRVSLPDGGEMSNKQYIQEVYAPHIPSNGKVNLLDDREISVVQFIEEYLPEGINKYNGDMGKILCNMTKSNDGLINTVSGNRINSVSNEGKSI